MSPENDLVPGRPRSSGTRSATSSQSSSPPTGTRTMSARESAGVKTPGRPDELSPDLTCLHCGSRMIEKGRCLDCGRAAR